MIKLKLNKNMNFNAITDSGHIISIDASKENGGKNKGSSSSKATRSYKATG